VVINDASPAIRALLTKRTTHDELGLRSRTGGRGTAAGAVRLRPAAHAAEQFSRCRPVDAACHTQCVSGPAYQPQPTAPDGP
jgi:hypothetical protein